VFFFGTFGLAVLALTGLALAVIFLSERSFVSLLAWPSASLNWLAARCRTMLSAWRSRRTVSAHTASRRGVPTPGEGNETLSPPAVSERPQPPADGTHPAAPVAKDPENQARPSRGQQALPFLPPAEGYTKPSLKFLDAPLTEPHGSNQDEMAQNSRLLEKKLLEFGVEGHVTAVNPGPVITSYELEPGPGIKINRIVALADDWRWG